MSDDLFPVPQDWAKKAWIDNDRYLRDYERSIKDPAGFWAEQAKRVDWIKAPTQIKDVSYGPGDVHIRWYYDGKLNVSTNCLDRHLAKRGNQVAIIWEGDDPSQDRKITYKELHAEVCKLANGLKSLGVKKGDRVSPVRLQA